MPTITSIPDNVRVSQIIFGYSVMKISYWLSAIGEEDFNSAEEYCGRLSGHPSSKASSKIKDSGDKS